MVKSALGESPMAPGSRLDTVLSMQYTVEVWVHLIRMWKIGMAVLARPLRYGHT